MNVLMKFGGIVTMALGLLVALASLITGHGGSEGLQALAIGFCIVYLGSVLETIESIADATDELLELADRSKKD